MDKQIYNWVKIHWRSETIYRQEGKWPVPRVNVYEVWELSNDVAQAVKEEV